MVKGQKAKAIGTPEQISEEAAKPLDQSAIVVGTGRHAVLQLQSAGGGQRCGRGRADEMLRGPSLTGKATERKTWYKASMLWSASSQDQEPGCRSRLDQLVGELPGGREHRSGGAGHPAEHRDPGRRSSPSSLRRSRRSRNTSPTSSPRSATPRSPHPPAAARWRPSCSVTGLMSSSGGRAQPTPRRSSWTR